MKKTVLAIIAVCIALQLTAQDQVSQSPILFIYDASGSMWGQMKGKTKVEIAAEVLSDAVDKLPENQSIGLVAYGHRREGDCKDVEFLVDLETGTKAQVIQAVKGIKPLGKTPLAYSAIQVIDKLRQSKLRPTIILITDGIESCDGDICEVVKNAKKDGIDFKLHIIGFGLINEDTRQLKCATEAASGNYYMAKDAAGLSEFLNIATAITIDKPIDNFSVFAEKNGNAIDAWVKAYDVVNKRKPIMVRTYKDTAHFYLPPSRYNFEVVPLEGSDVDMIRVAEIESFEDKMGHQTISFDAGKLKIETTNNGKPWDCIVKVFDQYNKPAASVRTYSGTKEVEVNPGIYKVTIQALAMEGSATTTEIENVAIESSSETPISYDFKTGDFEIFTKVDADNIDTIVTIKEVGSDKSIASARTYTRGANFLLNPASYEVKVVPLGIHKDKKTQTISIIIEPEKSITKELTF